MTHWIAPGLKKETFKWYNLDQCDAIIETVCFSLKVTKKDVVSKVRKREFVDARKIIIHKLRGRTSLSLKAIGGKLNMDHSTVIYSLNTYDDLCETDKLFKAKSDLINELI